MLKTDEMGNKLSCMLRLIAIGLIFLSIISAVPLHAQDEIILEHADSSRTFIYADSMVTYFYGNVHFSKGQAEIFADSVFFSTTGNYRFMGNIRFTDTTRSINTDLLLYNEDSNIFRAFGSSRLIDLGENITLSGDSVYYDNRTEVLTVIGEPHIIFNNQDPRKMIDVTCDSLVYYSKQNYGVAYDSVTILKGSLVAYCGEAVLMPDSNYLSLIENPRAYQDQNTVVGDSMSIYLENDLLDYIDVLDNAEAVYKQSTEASDTLFTESRLNAKKITFLFEDEELTRIQSAGNSHSEYIPVAGDSLVGGRNVASGDSIKLYFENRNLNAVEIITSVEGRYFSSAQHDSAGALISEDTIIYNSEKLIYNIDGQVINLYDSARVVHETVTLEADTIRYGTESKTVRAESFWEVTPAGDSTYHPVVLKDRNDVIYGERLAYNVDTRRGKIKESDTQLEQAYYHGNIIRKEDEDVLFVEGGRYTTCELDDPHFHFYSSDMKLITNDRVVAKPIVLYIDKIPVFYLPYFVFSIKKERHSGFLPFQIGNFERGTRFVNRLGYYWALSDYFDLETSIDYNDEVGVTFNLGFRYALRYKFSGSVDASYARETRHTLSGLNRRNRWSLNLNHRHTLAETASLNGSGNFISDASYYTDVSTDPEERLNRSLRSQLNFRKTWGRASFTAVVQGTNNLDQNNTTYNLPRLSFSLPSRAVFSAEDPSEKSWYQNLMLSYNVNSDNFISNTGAGEERTSRHYANIRHNISMSMPTTILKYFTISPNATINENWFYIFDTDQSREANLMTETGLRRAAFTFGMSSNTKLYGMFRPPISGLVALRHVVTPTLSYSYRPKADRHAEEASFAAIGSGGAESQSLRWSLGNLFQLKYRSGEQDKKLDLFTLNFSASYNFKAPAYKWSNLNTTMRSSTIPYLTFSLSASHDLYNRSTQRLDLLHPRLENLSLTTDFTYRGNTSVIGTALQGEPIDTLRPKFPGKPEKHPWSLSIGHRYAESRGAFTSITHTLTVNSEFNLTQNWKVSFSQYYNIKTGEVTQRRLSFYRDLHCWEAVFTWIPNGSLRGYYFRINVKSLPDIKFEKSESGINSPLSDQFSF